MFQTRVGIPDEKCFQARIGSSGKGGTIWKPIGSTGLVNKNFDHCSLRWYSNVLCLFLELISWTSITSKWFFTWRVFLSRRCFLWFIYVCKGYMTKSNTTIDYRLQSFRRMSISSNIYIHTLNKNTRQRQGSNNICQ